MKNKYSVALLIINSNYNNNYIHNKKIIIINQKLVKFNKY